MKRYIITLSEAHDDMERVQGALVRMGLNPGRAADEQFEGQPREFTFLPELGIVIATLSEIEMETIQQDGAVLAIEEDGKEQILGVVEWSGTILHNSTALWNMQLIRADVVWPTGKFGTGIKVAVIDTGIAAHPNLHIYGGQSYVAGVPSYADDNGHGTHCAGIIAGKGRNNVFGVAFGAHLYAVKVLDSGGSGSTSAVLSGMNWCIQNRMQVISMSLGGRRAPDIGYIRAIKKCHDNNVVVVCASGNSFGSVFPWVNAPANSFTNGDSLASPVAVASVDRNRVVATSSSRGGQTADWNQVTLSAPGVSILSTFLNFGYATMSGTSMACPHVAGLAALVLEAYPGIAPPIVMALMATSATPLGTAPYPNEPYGHGIIDCVNAVGIVQARRTLQRVTAPAV